MLTKGLKNRKINAQKFKFYSFPTTMASQLKVESLLSHKIIAIIYRLSVL
jgi:hypothetical protein